MLLSMILMVFGFVLMVLSGFGIPSADRRAALLSFGLACWILAEILKNGVSLIAGR